VVLVCCKLITVIAYQAAFQNLHKIWIDPKLRGSFHANP
jgi:hypothetical protein